MTPSSASTAPLDVARLVRTYSDLVFRVCYSRLGSVYDAQDACQTVFLKFVQLAQRGAIAFASAEHERAWFVRAAVTTSIDLQRDGWARRVGPLEGTSATGAQAPAEPHDGSPLADPAVQLELTEERAQVLAAVNALPPAQRQAVYLHYYESYTAKDIAELTGDKPSTVRKNLERARAKLRHILEGSAQ